MESIVRTVGLDLAKNSFHVFCADDAGRCVESKPLRRSQVLDYFEKLPRCRVAMETCTGENWWCRRLLDLGHDARLIPAVLRESQNVMLEVHDKLDESIDKKEKNILDWRRNHEASLRLAEMRGVGPMTASYLTAVLGDGSAYRDARHELSS